MEKVKYSLTQKCRIDDQLPGLPNLKNQSFSKALLNLNPKKQLGLALSTLSTSMSCKDMKPVVSKSTSASKDKITRKESFLTPFVNNKRSLNNSVVGHTILKEERKELVKMISNALIKNVKMVKSIKQPMENPQTIAYSDFLTQMRQSNGFVLPRSKFHYFKFYIARGNNSALVQRTLTKRSWWTITGSIRHANFIWTSVNKEKAFLALTASDKTQVLKTKAQNRLQPKISIVQKNLGYDLILKNEEFSLIEDKESPSYAIYNKLRGNSKLCSKKHMFKHLKSYYGESVFFKIPLTFHIKTGKKDASYAEFLDLFNTRKKSGLDNSWILKPGESTNRGTGITVTSSLSDITSIIGYPSYHTIIIQKYIERPLLFFKRKFDLRCFGLMSCINGRFQGYFYKDGYVRTSSYQYSTSSFNNYIHLTNDAIQKYSDMYGKYEDGNKLSYDELQNYFEEQGMDIHLYRDVVPKIRDIVKDTFRSVFKVIDKERRQHCFELFGYDFMIDQDFNVWLIEVNTNPCLEESSLLLSELLPELIDNTFRIILDPIFPPPLSQKRLNNWAKESAIKNQYELVFAEM